MQRFYRISQMRFGQQDKRVRRYVVKDKEHTYTVESKTVCLCSL